MTGIVASAVLGRLWGGINSLSQFIRVYPLPCACIALAGLSGLFWHQRNEARDQAATWQVAYKAQQASYRAAQGAAKAKELARYVRVQNEQQRINADVSQDYASRLAAIRARVASLRSQAGAAGSSPDHIEVRGLSPAPGGTAGEAADALAWRAIGAEQAAQLTALIEWTERQAAIDPNAP